MSCRCLYLWVEAKLPHDFISRVGSVRSSLKNSREAFVLKEASSCWAEVPAERERNYTVKISNRINPKSWFSTTTSTITASGSESNLSDLHRLVKNTLIMTNSGFGGEFSPGASVLIAKNNYSSCNRSRFSFTTRQDGALTKSYHIKTSEIWSKTWKSGCFKTETLFFPCVVFFCFCVDSWLFLELTTKVL